MGISSKRLEDLRAAKEEYYTLEHAKEISDDILRVIGINPDNSIEFPGLREARQRWTETLEAVGKEALETKAEEDR